MNDMSKKKEKHFIFLVSLNTIVWKLEISENMESQANTFFK